MVAVALDHAGDAGHPRVAVPGVVAQARVPRVCLGIRLVDHIETEFVAEIEEPRVVRVVRAPHGIHVVLLHQHQIGTHVVDGH